MIPARRLTWLILLIAGLTLIAAVTPFVFTEGPGPSEHVSVRGETVTLYGFGPYRHMPADVAIQGLAQDLVTLVLGLPLLLGTLMWARSGSRAGHLALTGIVGYVFVQYVLYLAMATYNELFLVWVSLVLLTSQVLVRLLLARPSEAFLLPPTRAWLHSTVGIFLIVNGAMIGLLWLSVIVSPLIDGALYPAGLAHFTTMIVQGFDLALFLPPSLIAGCAYVRRRQVGALLAPVYSVFLALQMTALLAKIIWMAIEGASVGPPLVIIPLLLVGALASAYVTLRQNAGLCLPQAERG